MARAGREPAQGGLRLPPPLPARLRPHLSQGGTPPGWHKPAPWTPQSAWNFSSGCLRKTSPTFLIATYKTSCCWQIALIFCQADSGFKRTQRFGGDDFSARLGPPGKERSRNIRAWHGQKMRMLHFDGQERELSCQNWEQLVISDKPNYKFIWPCL